MDLDYELIEYVRNFIPYPAFFDDLLPQYDEIIENLGSFLQQRLAGFCIIVDSTTEELVDYFDGNGFEVHRVLSSPFYVMLIPQYPPPEPDYVTVTVTVSSGWVNRMTLEPVEPVIEEKPICEKIFPEVPMKMVFSDTKPIKVVRETVRPPP